MGEGRRDGATKRLRLRDGGVWGRFLRMDPPLLTPLSPHPSLPVDDVGAAAALLPPLQRYDRQSLDLEKLEPI